LVDIAVAQAHGVFLISLGRYYAYVAACIQLLKGLFYLLLRNFRIVLSNFKFKQSNLAIIHLYYTCLNLPIRCAFLIFVT